MEPNTYGEEKDSTEQSDKPEKKKRISKEKSTKLVKDISKKVEKARQFREKVVENWEKWIAIYNGDLTYDRDQTWQSDLSIPMGQTVSERIIAKIMKSLFRGKPFELQATKKDDVETVEALDEYIEYQLMRSVYFKRNWERYLRQKVVLGTSCQKLYYVEESNSVMNEYVNMYQLYPDPSGSDVDSCGYVVHEFIKDKTYFKSKLKDGTYKLPIGVSEEEALSGEAPELNQGGETGFDEWVLDEYEKQAIDYSKKVNLCGS